MLPTTIAVLVASWLCLLKTCGSRTPVRPHFDPFAAELMPHWNPAIPYLMPGYPFNVPRDTSPGYIRRPVFERQRLREPWCPFPYNCVPGVVCPEHQCVPGLRCCRSLHGICCHPHNYTLTHYPPILPPHMTPPPPYPVALVLYPLPQHKLMVVPPSYHVPHTEQIAPVVQPRLNGRPPR